MWKGKIEERKEALTNGDLKLKIDKKTPYEYLALRIYDPAIKPFIYIFEEEFDSFPLKFIGDFSIGDTYRLYRAFRGGNLPKNFFSRIWDEQRNGELLKKVRSIPPISFWKRFIYQAIFNYRKGNYAACINLLLPATEGLLWQFSVYLHNMGEKIYATTAKINLQNKKKYSILLSSGKKVKNHKQVDQLMGGLGGKAKRRSKSSRKPSKSKSN